MLQRIQRHRLSILILTILLGISISIELLTMYDDSEVFFASDDLLFKFIFIPICIVISLFIGLIISLIVVSISESFLWFFTWLFSFFIPLQIAELVFPTFFNFLTSKVYIDMWLVSVLLAIVAPRILGSTYFARRLKRDLNFTGNFTLHRSAKEVWGMLVPLPENQETLFATTISGIEPLDPDRHCYKIYSNSGGQQKPDTMVFTKLQPFTEFTTQSLRIDMHGNSVKITENIRFVKEGDQTTIFVSETHSGMSLIDWLWNMFQSCCGDYYDGFTAYCNGKRDFSMRGVGRFRRALEKP